MFNHFWLTLYLTCNVYTVCIQRMQLIVVLSENKVLYSFFEHVFVFLLLNVFSNSAIYLELPLIPQYSPNTQR